MAGGSTGLNPTEGRLIIPGRNDNIAVYYAFLTCVSHLSLIILDRLIKPI